MAPVSLFYTRLFGCFTYSQHYEEIVMRFMNYYFAVSTHKARFQPTNILLLSRLTLAD